MLLLTFHGLGRPPAGTPDGERMFWVDVEIALPELLKRGMKGLFFVITGRINQQGFLSESDIRELHREGMSIGSHGENHVKWTGLSPDALHKEVVGSKATLEEVVGEAVTSAACPFGAYDRGTSG